MYMKRSTFSSKIISNLNATVESIINEFQLIGASSIEALDANSFAMRARISFKAGEVPLEEEFKGKRVVISADGGRIQTRVNKRDKKTKKNRDRYKTDWREPKSILVYVVNNEGEKDRKIPPIMDASLDGPDATFAMLIYYLKKLGIAAADKLLFVSDGAVWIWDRINDLILKVGIDFMQCILALDFYHAVEHLWDTQASGLKDSALGYGKTTTEMYQKNTFVQWNFNTVWNIDEGYSNPCLIELNCSAGK